MTRMQAISGLQAYERNVTLRDVVDSGKATIRAVKWAALLRGKGSGFLTIWGGPGNGKTMILQAMVNEFVLNGTQAVYVVFSDLITWMRDGYSHGNSSALDRLSKIAEVPFLAIDEWDKVKETEWLMEFKSNVMDRRYRNALSGCSATALAMNKDPQDVFDDMPWMLSRLRDGRFAFEFDKLSHPIPAIIENSDPDLRPFLTGTAPGALVV